MDLPTKAMWVYNVSAQTIDAFIWIDLVRVFRPIFAHAFGFYVLPNVALVSYDTETKIQLQEGTSIHDDQGVLLYGIRSLFYEKLKISFLEILYCLYSSWVSRM